MNDPSSPHLPLPGSEPPSVYRQILGAADPQEWIEVGLLLRRKPSSPGLPTLADLCGETPAVPLSRADFAALHGADPGDVAAVEAFAREQGLSLVRHDLVHRMVRLAGRAAALGRAFGVQLVTALSARGVCRTHLGPVHLPAALLPSVLAVLGLDNRPAARRHTCGAAGSPPGASSPGPRPMWPAEAAAAYRFPPGSGAGQSVAILELGGGFEPQDIAAYFAGLGIRPPAIDGVSLSGAGNRPSSPPSAADVEVTVDVEIVGALVPAAALTVYFAPNTNLEFIAMMQQAVHDPRRDHGVISLSWTEVEKSWAAADLAAMNEVLREAACLGITVCVASGDDGASGEAPPGDGWAHVEFPSSSPFALACGGTQMTLADGRAVAEVAWHETNGATGGGVSAAFPVPPYQQAAGLEPLSVNPGHRPGRGLPDVAANAASASGYLVFVGGRLGPIGGTSTAAPLWAGLVARLNEQAGRRLGFLNPAFYRIGAGAAAVSAFRDIVAGNNANAAWAGGYAAAPGWDACTGWGSPDGENLLAALGFAPAAPAEAAPRAGAAAAADDAAEES